MDFSFFLNTALLSAARGRWAASFQVKGLLCADSEACTHILYTNGHSLGDMFSIQLDAFTFPGYVFTRTHFKLGGPGTHTQLAPLEPMPGSGNAKEGSVQIRLKQKCTSCTLVEATRGLIEKSDCLIVIHKKTR